MALVRRSVSIEPSELASTLLSAVLDDSQCVCGSRARRMTVERTPLNRWDRFKRRTMPEGPLAVRTWCGDTDKHLDDWDPDNVQSGEHRDPEAVAMVEEDF